MPFYNCRKYGADSLVISPQVANAAELERRSRSLSESASSCDGDGDEGDRRERVDSAAGDLETSKKRTKRKKKKKDFKKRKKKKHKKKKKKRSKKYHREDSKKKKKKKKKKKRKRSDDSDDSDDSDEEKRATSSRSACDQNAFGSRGFLRESDMFRKQPEFELWLREVKSVEISMLSSREQKEYFKTYAEDYNTVTLPDEKYYDVEKWHRRQTAKRARKEAKARSRLLVQGDRSVNEMTTFDDERARKLEESERRRKEKLEEAYASLNRMDANKAKAMREKQILMRQMQIAHKTGNTREVERIKLLIETPEEKMKRYGYSVAPG
eukprot:g2600.t1